MEEVLWRSSCMWRSSFCSGTVWCGIVNGATLAFCADYRDQDRTMSSFNSMSSFIHMNSFMWRSSLVWRNSLMSSVSGEDRWCGDVIGEEQFCEAAVLRGAVYEKLCGFVVMLHTQNFNYTIPGGGEECLVVIMTTSQEADDWPTKCNRVTYD